MTRREKEIILASNGFVSLKMEDQINRIIDEALRARIVISSMDAKGLPMLMPESDASSNFDPTLVGAMNRWDASHQMYATAVLAEMAEGTGGDYFHNNNDLKAGFALLGEQPVSYILAFAPHGLDGKFHKLHVKLTQSKGTVQARSGYFAAKTEPSNAGPTNQDEQAGGRRKSKSTRKTSFGEPWPPVTNSTSFPSR